MKQRIILSIGLGALTRLAFITPPGTLVGRWQKIVAPGVTVLHIFRSDSTFDIFVNGKTFTRGKYRVRQDTFAIADQSCGMDYYGTYKLNFITPDSIQFTAIADLCKGRREGMHHSATGRPSK